MARSSPNTSLDFNAPKAISPEDVQQNRQLVPQAKNLAELEAKVDGFISDLLAQDLNSPDFDKRIDAITALGAKEIRDASSQSNRFLERPVKAMDKESGVGQDLVQLRRIIEDLDPTKRGNLTRPRKLFGLIPFGSKVRDYMETYKSSQQHITTVLSALATGKEDLLMDNAAVDAERQTLWTAMGRLEQMIKVSEIMDAKLETVVSELDHTDPAKARAIRESALFYTRQRTQDLMTQMAVSSMGYLALDQVKKNNVELVKGVDRASTTTVAALRTAVTVAQALTSQKQVVESIASLNSTTTTVIDSTGKLLKKNSAEINEQAATATISVETLQRAFQNVYDTMDAIDDFKLKALQTMKSTVDSLGTEVDRSRGYIARSEGAEQAKLIDVGDTNKGIAIHVGTSDTSNDAFKYKDKDEGNYKDINTADYFGG